MGEMVVNPGAIDALNEQIATVNEQITPYAFSTEYSSILAMVNDQVTTKGKKLPFSFVKSGTAVLTDAPSGLGNAEFTGIVDGNGQRLNVSIKSYSTAAYTDYTRDIFNGNWISQWYSIYEHIAQKSSLKVITIVRNNLSATSWGNHHYQDFDVASDVPSGYMLIAALPMSGTSGSVLSVSVQGGTIIRLLNDANFTGATLNISLICAKGLQ